VKARGGLAHVDIVVLSRILWLVWPDGSLLYYLSAAFAELSAAGALGSDLLSCACGLVIVLI
jgi:hypothetical protein